MQGLPPPPPPVEILSGEEVADLLGLNTKTVYAGAARGELPARKVGRRWIFERGAILSWLRETRSGAAEDREVRRGIGTSRSKGEDRRAKSRGLTRRQG